MATKIEGEKENDRTSVDDKLVLAQKLLSRNYDIIFYGKH